MVTWLSMVIHVSMLAVCLLGLGAVSSCMAHVGMYQCVLPRLKMLNLLDLRLVTLTHYAPIMCTQAAHMERTLTQALKENAQLAEQVLSLQAARTAAPPTRALAGDLSGATGLGSPTGAAGVATMRPEPQAEVSRLRLAALLQIVTATQARLQRQPLSNSMGGGLASPASADSSSSTTASIKEEDAMGLGLDALTRKLEKRVRAVLLSALEAQQETRQLASRVSQLELLSSSAAVAAVAVGASPLVQSPPRHALSTPGMLGQPSPITPTHMGITPPVSGGDAMSRSPDAGMRVAHVSPRDAHTPTTAATAPALGVGLGGLGLMGLGAAHASLRASPGPPMEQQGQCVQLGQRTKELQQSMMAMQVGSWVRQPALSR